jgi:hypothetical protein
MISVRSPRHRGRGFGTPFRDPDSPAPPGAPNIQGNLQGAWTLPRCTDILTFRCHGAFASRKTVDRARHSGGCRSLIWTFLELQKNKRNRPPHFFACGSCRIDGAARAIGRMAEMSQTLSSPSARLNMTDRPSACRWC